MREFNDAHLNDLLSQERLKPKIESQTQPLGSLKIVMLDDLDLMRRVVKNIIQAKGGECYDTSTEQEFLEAYRMHRPDAVIVDNMNEKKEERAVPIAERLVAEYNAPWRSIIAFSGACSPEIPGYFRSRGAQFLAKPFTPDELVDAVKYATGR